MQRRRLLALGAAAAAVLAIAGGTAALVRPGLVDSRLSPAGREVFAAVAAAVLEGTLPADAAARRQALDGLLDRIDALVAGLPPHAQAELSQLLALLATTGGRVAFAGLAHPWADADRPTLRAALQSMRMSSASLRQQAYHALHDITSGAYFSDPATWAVLGYPGPIAV